MCAASAGRSSSITMLHICAITIVFSRQSISFCLTKLVLSLQPAFSKAARAHEFRHTVKCFGYIVKNCMRLNFSLGVLLGHKWKTWVLQSRNIKGCTVKMGIWSIPQLQRLELQKKMDDELLFACVHTVNFNENPSLPEGKSFHVSSLLRLPEKMLAWVVGFKWLSLPRKPSLRVSAVSV